MSEFVFEFVQLVQSEFFTVDGFGEKAGVMGFLTAEAERAHLSFGELEKAARGEGLDSILQAFVQSAGGGEGYCCSKMM